MDRIDAFRQLKRFAAPDTDPALADEDLAALLDATARWTVWQPATAYPQGALVVPTVRNGRVYRALLGPQTGGPVPGVSGQIEPVWPLRGPADGRPLGAWPSWAGADGLGDASWCAAVDDGTLRWAAAGPDGAQYDVRRAAHEAWLLKAGRASARITATFGPDKTYAAQLFDHCTAMADRYRPAIIL